MKGTALGAENREMNFMNNAHEKFYYEKLKEVRYQDVYHKALVYCLGVNRDTREHIDQIYDFKTGYVKTESAVRSSSSSGSGSFAPGRR